MSDHRNPVMLTLLSLLTLLTYPFQNGFTVLVGALKRRDRGSGIEDRGSRIEDRESGIEDRDRDRGRNPVMLTLLTLLTLLTYFTYLLYLPEWIFDEFVQVGARAWRIGDPGSRIGAGYRR